jgi:2,5-diketo-D-gluconate reductase B
LQEIASAHRRSVAQIVLRWIMQQGFITLSKTVSEVRAAENAAIFDFDLSRRYDMAMIQKMAQPDGRIVSPDGSGAGMGCVGLISEMLDRVTCGKRRLT